VVQAPEQANPFNPNTRINQGYHQLMIESLFYLNYESGKADPWLATSADYNKDFTQVDIKVRPGVEWSDGQPFTADDVAFTLNMLRGPNATGLAYGPEMQKFVKEAVAVDKQTARVTLTEPYPRFIFNNFTVHIWGAVRIVPKHIWDGQDPLKFSNFDMSKGWPIWTGPYRLIKAGASEFDYDRRDDWWATKTGFHALPAPERVVFVDAGTEEKKAAALQANQVDAQPSLAPDLFIKVKEANPNAIGWTDMEPYTWIDPCPPEFGINNEVAPWNDPDMRWAVNYAIDKQKIADATSFGHGQLVRYNFPAYPPLNKLLDENADLFQKYPTTTYDPGKSKSIFESKGYKLGSDGVYAKDGQRLQVDLLTISTSITQSTVPVLLANLKAVGIDVQPSGVAETQFHERRYSGDYVFECGPHVACGSVVDPYAELNLTHSQWILPKGQRRSTNQWGYKNPDYDKIVDQVRLTQPGDPAIDKLFSQALEMRLRDLPFFNLAQQLRVVPYSNKYWTNWPTAKNNYIHPPNWWMTSLQLFINIKPAA